MKTFLIAAISADGYIAPSALEKSTNWTSKEDARFFMQKTKQAGVVLMGSRTFSTIGKPLPERKNIVLSRSAADLQRDNTYNADELVFSSQTPAELVAELAQEGFEQLAVIGGAEIYTLFLEADLIDELYLTVEPVVFGSGVPLFSHGLQAPLPLQLTEVIDLSSQTKVLHYIVTQK